MLRVIFNLPAQRSADLMETRRVSEEQISVTDSLCLPRLRSGLPKTLNQQTGSGEGIGVYTSNMAPLSPLIRRQAQLAFINRERGARVEF